MSAFVACGKQISSATTESDHFQEGSVCQIGAQRRLSEPCSIVIFGASGDLTARKLIPALYHLCKDKLMPSSFRIIGFARRDKTDEAWRTELREALGKFSRSKPVDEEVWKVFAANVHYCVGDMTGGPHSYEKLEKLLTSFGAAPLRHNLLFYLATQPSQFGAIIERLQGAATAATRRSSGGGWQRVVTWEKPFGHDLASARALNDEVTRYADESQVYRIDHYLGKETVQNILMFRFSNSIFEQLWNRNSIDHVQITVSEKLGVGARGGYYEEAGALRDMVQNHMLQVLALTAMEPPVSLESEAIRDEKVKLLKSIRPLTRQDVARQVVRGQYFASLAQGVPVPGYRQEPKVKPDSNVETYVGLKLFIDNWRWSGVPFYPAHGQISAAKRERGSHPIQADAQCALRRPMRADFGIQRWPCACNRRKASTFISMARCPA